MLDTTRRNERLAYPLASVFKMTHCGVGLCHIPQPTQYLPGVVLYDWWLSVEDEVSALELHDKYLMWKPYALWQPRAVQVGRRTKRCQGLTRWRDAALKLWMLDTIYRTMEKLKDPQRRKKWYIRYSWMHNTLVASPCQNHCESGVLPSEPSEQLPRVRFLQPLAQAVGSQSFPVVVCKGTDFHFPAA